MLTVHVIAAGAHVRAGETHKGECCTVSTAADRNDERLYAVCLHSGFCNVNDLHMREDHFLHIEIAVLYFCIDQFTAVFAVEEVGSKQELFLACVEFRFVMVTDDIVQLSVLDFAVEACEMCKTFIAFGVFLRNISL